MAEFDPSATQRDLVPDLVSELAADGFDEADEVGAGGFGVVYRARQRSLDRTVAVKVLTAELEVNNLERFLREQRAMGRLSGHPNIVNILQVGATRTGRPYIVMQYHSRGSLDARIRRSGPLDWGAAVHLGVKLCGALEGAHRAGTLHRDVKPANILLTDYSEPQLTDFGIARIAGGFETSSGAVSGSPAFTAPELLEGRAPTAASDVYGLGATLFCALTGHAAYERREGEQVIAQFLRIANAPIPDLRAGGIPDDICAAVEAAMAREPGDRPATALEFGEQLRQAQQRHGLSVDEMALPGETRTEHGNRSGPATTGSLTIGAGRRWVTTVTPPTSELRFRPPAPTPGAIERTRLIAALRAARPRLLTVIHAPTGYGKSTLAAQWRQVLIDDGVPVAWLTVDHDDNNVVWFLAHLIEAIRRVRPALAHDLGLVLEEHGDDAQRYVLTSLVNEIHTRGDHMAVVVDDWHRVTDSASVGALEFFLDSGCHHLQLIVTSRSRAGLPLSRLLVRDDVIEIDSAALRFDATESQAFLVDRGGLPLASEDVTHLRESTDGWIAALKLASLSLRESDDPAALIEHLTGRHHAIGEFLAQNVLDSLDPETLDFLLATSVTERTCGGLAAELAAVPNGHALLERVEERDLFLRRVDEEGEWFRYHTLFAEYLRKRLERDHPERVGRLHRAASTWFAEHQHWSEAVDHALAAGDQGRAVELVESQGGHLLERSRMATLLGLIAKLPARRVISSLRLQLDLAWANALLRRGSAADAALDLVHALLDQRVDDEADAADLRVEADVVTSVMRIFGDRIEGIEGLVAECLSRPDTLRPWVVSVAANTAGAAALRRFEYDEARRMQAWATTYHLRTEGSFSLVFGYNITGRAAYEQLDVAVAEDNFRRALRVAQDTAGTHSHAARLAGAQLGVLLYERGRITEAEHLLDESHELGMEGGGVDFLIAQYGVGARIKALGGDRTGAAIRLDEGSRVAATMSGSRMAVRLENERVRLGFPPTRPPVAHPSRRRPVDRLDEEIVQVEEDTAIRLLLATGDSDAVESACDWAAEWVRILDGRGRLRALLDARRLLMVCLWAAGRCEEAGAVFTEIGVQCAERGMARYLLDGGTDVAALARYVRAQRWAGRGQPRRREVPDSFLDELSAGDGQS